MKILTDYIVPCAIGIGVLTLGWFLLHPIADTMVTMAYTQ